MHLCHFDDLNRLTVHKKQKWLNQVGFQISQHMISQGSDVETAPDQKRKFDLKLLTFNQSYLCLVLNNTNLLIGLVYASKMSFLNIQQYFLYDKIRKHASNIT